MIVAVWIGMIVAEANGLDVPTLAWVILYASVLVYGVALGLKIMAEA